MKKVFKIFIKKFDVPENLRNYTDTIFSEEEVFVFNFLADKEENMSSLSDKFSQLKPHFIESLYKKGYLVKKLKNGEIYFRSNTFEQILKRFINHNPKYLDFSREEKIQLQEYIASVYIKKMKASKKPVYRVIPIEKALEDKRQLVPHHQAVYYLQKASAISLIDCICRTTFNRCNKPRNVCLALGEQAKFFIDREIGEEIDVQRGLKILNISQENGLVHSINNKENPNFLCNCCACCCVFVQGLKKYGIFTSIGKSGFTAINNLELCDQCQICAEKCIFEAISNEEEAIKFDKDKCFGCGLCAYNCPQTAVKLILKKKEKTPQKLMPFKT